METFAGLAIFLVVLIISAIAFAVFITGAFRLRNNIHETNTQEDTANLKYLFSTDIGSGKITFITSNSTEIITSIHCIYIPFESSKFGVKPLINIPEEFITSNMIKNIQYYSDTVQRFSIFCEETDTTNIFYSIFPFSYAFDEAEEDIRNSITELLLKAYDKECEGIAIPIYLTDKVHIDYETYKRALTDPIKTILKNRKLNVMLFSKNERLEWEIIDNL